MPNARRAARNQPLPPEEVLHLQILLAQDPRALYARCKGLYTVGWTLRAIGEAFIPPRSRSTVRSWVLRATADYTDRTIPTPTLSTPAQYIPRRPASPGISPAEQAEIARLAPVARTFRAKMASTSPAAVANTRLTALTRELHARNVGIQELATAAGVTYRAMARRVG